MVALHEEPGRPNSALDFLKHQLEATNSENPRIELLCLELSRKWERNIKLLVEEVKNRT